MWTLRIASSHPFRAELLATSPPACRLAPGPRNSPRDSLRKMRSSGTRSGFQQPSELYRRHIESDDRYFAYVDYPYIEWYSEENGRVVLELDPLQVEVLNEEGQHMRRETPSELHPVKGEAAMFDI